MKTRLAVLWDALRTSFWFVPMMMTLAAALLAFATVSVDAELADSWVRNVWWLYAGGADGATGVLTAVAGSMITIAALVFSLTLVALSLTSSQLGPRLLRTFMRDPTNQVALGTFVSTFVYCLLVLRTVRRVEESSFVPHLSVTLGVALAVISLAVLIYFIHHVALSVQADETAARVAAQFLQNIDRLYPEHIGAAPEPDKKVVIPDDFESNSRLIPSSRDGYVQAVDAGQLLELAKRADLILRVERRPGQFVVAGRPLVRLWPAERFTDEMEGQVNGAFVIGNQRTESQDIEYAASQLVEIAVRALSPGINDPFTAVACIDWIGSALTRLAKREIPSAYRHDDEGHLRVIAYPTTFNNVADASLNQVRQYGATCAAVIIRLLEIIESVAAAVERPDDRASLLRHAEMILRSGREHLSEEEDRSVVEARYTAVRLQLDGNADNGVTG